jgi:hypothetical protein
MKTLNIHGAVALLNEAVTLDADAIDKLVKYRVPVKTGFADHPSIVIMEGENNEDVLGILGLLNGMFQDEDGCIAAVWNTETNKLNGFKVLGQNEVEYKTDV